MDALTGLWSGVEALVAILLGLAVLRLLRLAHFSLAATGAEAVPRLALGAGLALGLALMLSVPHAEAFRPSLIFAQEGPWRMHLLDLLARHALPSRATLAAAMRTPSTALGLLLLAGAMVLAARRWRGPAALRALGALLLLTAGTGLLLHYAAHLLAWMLALLNFWLFAIALLVFQRWRYAVPRERH
jgi:hypothetical protein